MFVRFFSFLRFLCFLDLKKNSAGWRKKIFYLNVRFLFLKKKFAGGARAGVVLFCDTGDFLGKVRIVGKCRRNSKYII